MVWECDLRILPGNVTWEHCLGMWSGGGGGECDLRTLPGNVVWECDLRTSPGRVHLRILPVNEVWGCGLGMWPVLTFYLPV